MPNEETLLPTEKSTAQERLNELVSKEYREKHEVNIRSVQGYEGALPTLKPCIYNNNTIRAFPDGFEVITQPNNGMLYDDKRKYIVDFFWIAEE